MSELINRARELEEDGRLEEALNYFDMVIEDKSGSFDIRSEKGRVLNKLKRYEEANDCFDLVLIMDENHISSLFGKGIAYLGLGNWEESYTNFIKALNLDKKNANLWYYTAILLKEQNDDNAEGYYKKFKELDELDESAHFEKERSSYKVGLLFKEMIRELECFDEHYNIAGYREQLGAYGLKDEEISLYLKTMDEEDLTIKIQALQDELNKTQEKETLYEGYAALGLDKNEVDDLLESELETIDSLKKDLISDLGYNPFNVDNDFAKIDLYDNFKSMPINHAFNYKIRNDFDIYCPKTKKDLFSFEGIMGILTGKRTSEKNEKIRKYIQKNFKLLDDAILDDNYTLAEDLFINIKNSSIGNFDDLTIKLDYYDGLLKYFNYREFKEALQSFNLVENKYRSILSKYPYRYNKGCILYDYGKYDEALLHFNALKLKNDRSNFTYDKIRYLRSSAYYNIQDYENALNEYAQISNENQNKEVVQLLIKKNK